MGFPDDPPIAQQHPGLATRRLVQDEKDLEKLLAKLPSFRGLFSADFLDTVYEIDPCERSGFPNRH